MPAWGVLRARSVSRRFDDDETTNKAANGAPLPTEPYRVVISWCLQDLLNAIAPSSVAARTKLKAISQNLHRQKSGF